MTSTRKGRRGPRRGSCASSIVKVEAGVEQRASDWRGASSKQRASGSAEEETDWAAGFLRPDGYRAYRLAREVESRPAQRRGRAVSELIAEVREAAAELERRADPAEDLPS